MDFKSIRGSIWQVKLKNGLFVKEIISIVIVKAKLYVFHGVHNCGEK